MTLLPGLTARAWVPLYRAAGIAALLFVAFGVAALSLYFVNPPPVSGGEATLRFIADHKASYVAQQLLWLVPSLFGLVVFTALLVAHLSAGPSLAVLGFVVGAGSWIALLAVPTTSVGTLALVTLSDQYRAADAGARSAFVAAAEALVASNNTVTLAGILTPLGVLLICLPMVRGVLPHWIGWLGLATGALGLASEALRFAVTSLYAVYGPLLWVWFAAVGIALLRLDRASPAPLP
ncbi:DUF4386 family protein [Sinomonas sp. ASV486]|uniref:DUF4386 family protein n=1 Tax=Sinomonas sp. ASV486 TaxID=3051170 RepID=UPI0027DBDF1A|nr:DUF4386 family protein [Sinomonas sp. ASV486]MDQ4491886.1 DUF4386 family protein [Sinomonas sp. ASV486]